eukprot:2048478-Rhodomonas_salina.1
MYSAVGPRRLSWAVVDLFGVLDGARPLLTLLPEFSMAYMEQSSSIQASHTGSTQSRNQITLRFAVNVDLPAASQLTISGVRSTLSLGPSISISSAPAVFQASATWSNSLGQLSTVSTSSTIAKGTVVEIKFMLNNPVLAQNSPDISVLIRAYFHGDNTLTPIGPTSVDKGQDKHAPLQIDSAFLAKSIRQTNSLYNALNEIFITLAVNVNLIAGDRLILSGFTGATAPEGMVAVPEHNPGAQFWGNGLWDDISKTLEIIAAQNMPACQSVGCEH